MYLRVPSRPGMDVTKSFLRILNPRYAAISAPKKTKVVDPLTASNKATPIVLLKFWRAASIIITKKVKLRTKFVSLTNP